MSDIGRMVLLQISSAAFEAIEATLPGNVNVESKRAPNGDYFVWLDPATVANLKALRGPGEDFSVVILRLAGATAARLRTQAQSNRSNQEREDDNGLSS